MLPDRANAECRVCRQTSIFLVISTPGSEIESETDIEMKMKKARILREVESDEWHVNTTYS